MSVIGSAAVDQSPTSGRDRTAAGASADTGIAAGGSAGRRHWSSYNARCSRLGTLALVKLYRVLGPWLSGIIFYPVIVFIFLTGRRERTASLQYLRRLYATPAGRAELGRPPGLWASFLHLREFGIAVCDRVSSWSGTLNRLHVDWGDKEPFRDLIRTGRGAVFIGAHLGNIEVLRAVMDDFPDLRINALAFQGNTRYLNEALAMTNPHSNLNVILVDAISIDTAISLQERLDRGECIAILGDRTPPVASSHHCVLPFLGEPAPFPEGPFILASLLACPVYLLFCLRHGRSRYKVYVEPFADRLHFPRRSRKKAIRDCIARYVERVEHHCCMAPYQWFNYYDFWESGSDSPET